ncbi:MAG: hypothetical protein MUE30_00110 [Spirosomaceae bacterium]|nr:hypothetical protein [Spirosomataceae bacterium]
MTHISSHKSDSDLPPFIKSWPQMYGIVIGTLLIQMLLFYWMMRYFE